MLWNISTCQVETKITLMTGFLSAVTDNGESLPKKETIAKRHKKIEMTAEVLTRPKRVKEESSLHTLI